MRHKPFRLIVLVIIVTGSFLFSSLAHAEYKWSHPLHELLNEKAETEELKTGIYWLDAKNYDAAAYAIVPGYVPTGSGFSSGRVKNPGGNDPVYWAALRLACEGIGASSLYRYNLKKLPPTDPVVLRFAEHMEPMWQIEGLEKRLDKIPEFAALFGYRANK